MVIEKWVDVGSGIYLYNYGDGDVSIKTKETGDYEIFITDIQIKTLIQALQQVQKMKESGE